MRVLLTFLQKETSSIRSGFLQVGSRIVSPSVWGEGSNMLLPDGDFFSNVPPNVNSVAVVSLSFASSAADEVLALQKRPINSQAVATVKIETVGKRILKNAMFPALWSNGYEDAEHRFAAFLLHVLDGAGLAMPKNTGASVRDIRHQMFLSKQWQLVYKEGRVPIQQFEAQPGDVVIWDKSSRLHNAQTGGETVMSLGACGILDGKGKVYHPGCDTRSSANSRFADICKMPSYGNPTAIYRRVEPAAS
jgi:hypothetical protein